MSTASKMYSSDVTDGEWEFVAPYLCLMNSDSKQQSYSQRDLFNALRYVVEMECQWRMLPIGYPPFTAVYQQALRWKHAGIFETMTHDLRVIIRLLQESDIEEPLDLVESRSRSPGLCIERRAESSRSRNRHGSAVQMVVEATGHLHSMIVKDSDDLESSWVNELDGLVHQMTSGDVKVELTSSDFSTVNALSGSNRYAMEMKIIRHSAARRGFLMFPKRWEVDYTFNSLVRFCRLAREYEHLAEAVRRFDS